MIEGKAPAFQFYPDDWLSDTKLNLCSLQAQAFWLRLLCVMHTCAPYGHLTFDGITAPTPRDIGRVTGVHPLGVPPLVSELERRGVLSRTPGGVIYSRRMVRDERNRLINRQNGKYGGNPMLVNPVNPPVKAQVKPPDKASSSSSSVVRPHTPLSGVLATPIRPRENGTNPRANGTNPRAMEINPRALERKVRDQQRHMLNAMARKAWMDNPPESEVATGSDIEAAKRANGLVRQT